MQDVRGRCAPRRAGPPGHQLLACRRCLPANQTGRADRGADAGVQTPDRRSGDRGVDGNGAGGGRGRPVEVPQRARTGRMARPGAEAGIEGGRPTLPGVSKRGDRYVRTLMIHGARSTLRFAADRTERRNRWAAAVEERRGATWPRWRWPTGTPGPRGRCWRASRRSTPTIWRRQREDAAGIPGTPMASPCQAAARLLRFATALRVARRHHRRRGGRWPEGLVRPSSARWISDTRLRGSKSV